MPRPPKFNDEQVLDHALALAATASPNDVSVKAIAAAMEAPSGSIYYRFASRDLLMGSLWLRCVERFQSTFLSLLALEDPIQASVRAAVHTVEWSRSNVLDAQVLLLHRRQDFMGPEWPAALVDRNRRQESLVVTALNDIAERLHATETELERIRFAVIGIPLGAVRPFLSRGEAPTDETERLVEEATLALLSPFEQRLTERHERS